MGLESNVLEIVNDIYGAALGDEDWAGPLCALADFCGAENAALVRVDHTIGYSSVVAPRADPDVTAAYNQEWWAQDPTVQATSTAPVGRITGLIDTGREAFHKSTFYNEFWSRSGLGAERLAANLALTEAGFVSCVLQASAKQDVLDREAERRFSLLTPHLIRAVAIQTRLQSLALENGVLMGLRDVRRAGLIVVDAALRILFADEAAETLLTDGAGVHFHGGSLGLVDARADDLLQQAVTACVGSFQNLPMGCHIPWRRNDGGRALVVEVVPWSSAVAPIDVAGAQPAAILLLHDPGIETDVRERGDKHGAAPTAEAVPRSRTRAELFATITRDIVANLGESEISLSWLAGRHGVTPRRIRDLFYARNTSFTDYLLNARLNRAKEMLINSALAHVNVATIALDCGFGDVSWFHHTFRRRFNMTPTVMRQASTNRAQ